MAISIIHMSTLQPDANTRVKLEIGKVPINIAKQGDHWMRRIFRCVLKTRSNEMQASVRSPLVDGVVATPRCPLLQQAHMLSN